MKYRPEIDGLRTIAVIPVVIYHLKIPIATGQILPGGFLGVDIFFVISGFLITKIICEEIQVTGHFSILGFYARRARRILPALLLVILASLLAALWLMTPTELTRLLWSSLAALGFISNFFWFFELGEYGAQSGFLQPLLHTWSLAIEEQFYLVFPLALILLRPRSAPARALCVLIVILFLSLAASEFTSHGNKDLSFFSPISRAWELLTGAIMAIAITYFPTKSAWRPKAIQLVPKIALAVIIACMVLVDLGDWSHPGLITVPVVLATAALIWFARPGEVVTSLLSSRPFVYIGKLSYSIYLWHFPVFAFGQLSLVETPGIADKLLWLAIAAALSVCGYYLVEKPFRYKASTRNFWLGVGAACAVIFSLVALDRQTDLLKTTSNQDLAALYGGPYYDNDLLRDQSWSILGTYSDKQKIGPWNAHKASRSEQNKVWFSDPGKINVLVIGNSHSKDMFNALHHAALELDDFEFARFGIATGFPDAQVQDLIRSPNFAQADVVMIAPRYSRNTLNVICDLIARVRAAGKIVVVVGNTAHFLSPGQRPIYDYFVQRSGAPANPGRINDFSFWSRETDVALINQDLREIAEAQGAMYLSRVALLCADAQRTCTLATPKGAKVMYDYGHWTMQGAQYVGQRIIDTNWLDPLLQRYCAQKSAALCDQDT